MYVRRTKADSLGGTVVTQPIAGIPGAYVAEARGKYIKPVEQHIPAGTVALKKGAKVVGADGKAVGSVERVITAADAGGAGMRTALACWFVASQI